MGMLQSMSVCLAISTSYALVPPKQPRSSLSSLQVTSIESDTWQNKLDIILNIDTSSTTRRALVRELVGNWRAVSKDVVRAVQDKDLSVIAPKGLEYSKSIAGIQTVQKQLVSDIIPDLISKGVPQLLEEGPKQVQAIIDNRDKVISKGKDIVASIREISGDPSALQSTIEDIRREVRNVVRRTPEGLDSPAYEVVSKTDIYELRTYASYAVCGTKMPVEVDKAAPLIVGQSFNTLAGYIFGENDRAEKFAMTTPVIMADGNMEFVLPTKLSAITAPLPSAPEIFIKDVPSETIATVEFTGFATDGEVARQRALLEDALLTDGIMFDNLSFRVLQYNPPYTLPWLRRNEVALRVIQESTSTTTDASQFSTSPEAGD